MFTEIKINHNPAEVKIALLSGGSSSEREISLKSAEGVEQALLKAGYPVQLIDISKQDQLISLMSEGYDFAFICVHGKGGEDGSLQGFLQTIDIPYTGSGILASAISMDKSKSKTFYELAGIPTPESLTIDKSFDIDAKLLLDGLGGKAVVKVPTEGSSIGVYIVDNVSLMKEALSECFDMSDEVLVEKFIKGREFTCAVISSENDIYPFPVIEIIPQNSSYDFESKYKPGGSEHICPAKIDKDLVESIQEYAAEAHRALGCSGVSRTDFILDDNDDVWALETNTVPGMTATSLLPDAAKAVGIDFPELVKLMVQTGLDVKRI